MGNALPVQAVEPEDIANAVAWLVSDAGPLRHRRHAAGRRGLRQQALMARNPAAQTAFGPMVQAAIEQYEPPGRRLVDDDLAAVDPARGPTRDGSCDAAGRSLRRLTIAAGERAVPGSVGAHRVPQALHR